MSLLTQDDMGPSTYTVLGNMKIPTTALLYKVIIKSHMGAGRWAAIALLTLGPYSTACRPWKPPPWLRQAYMQPPQDSSCPVLYCIISCNHRRIPLAPPVLHHLRLLWCVH